MKIFITADHHFNHENIIKYCKRLFKTVEEMNEFMIEKWNEEVGKKDLVIHLGDFGFGKDKIKKIREKINGTIILVQGNHDYKNMEDCGFIVVKEPIKIKNLVLTHRPLPLEKIPKSFVNVHGHIHEKESTQGINISVDETGFYPVKLDELLNKLKK